MFWRVPNKMEQRKELTGFYLFMRMETVLSNVMRNWQSFTASLVLQIVMWRYRDAKEPLTPEQEKKKKKNYFFMITSVLTKPGYCVLSRRAKCPCFHPHSLQSRLKVLFLSFFFPGEDAETGRAEVCNGCMVCQHLSFQSSWLFPSS